MTVFFPIESPGKIKWYDGYPLFSDDEWSELQLNIQQLIKDIKTLNEVLVEHIDRFKNGCCIDTHYLKCDTDIPYTIQGIIEIDELIRSPKREDIVFAKENLSQNFKAVKKSLNKVLSNEKVKDWISDKWNHFLLFLYPRKPSEKAKWEKDEVIYWNHNHLLGYFLKKYYEHYGISFTLNRNGLLPSKSRDIYEIKKLQSALSSNPEILINYIDWIFKTKVIEKKKRITSLGYFTHVDIVNEYKFKYLLNKKGTVVGRSDQLPAGVKEICARFGLDIGTYAELAFVKKMPDQAPLLNALVESGFKIDILDKIA